MTTELIQWEYITFNGSSLLGDEKEFLKERGLLGWELVSIIWLHNLSQEKRYYFKRPIIQSTDKQKP